VILNRCCESKLQFFVVIENLKINGNVSQGGIVPELIAEILHGRHVQKQPQRCGTAA
jgi:hypothetical protein